MHANLKAKLIMFSFEEKRACLLREKTDKGISSVGGKMVTRT